MMYLRNELDNFVQTQPDNIMIDNTIMENLHNYLPKDLVNIIEEYSKDRTNYDITLIEMQMNHDNEEYVQ